MSRHCAHLAQLVSIKPHDKDKSTNLISHFHLDGPHKKGGLPSKVNLKSEFGRFIYIYLSIYVSIYGLGFGVQTGMLEVLATRVVRFMMGYVCPSFSMVSSGKSMSTCCRIQDLGFRAQGAGVGVRGPGFMVS